MLLLSVLFFSFLFFFIDLFISCLIVQPASPVIFFKL